MGAPSLTDVRSLKASLPVVSVSFYCITIHPAVYMLVILHHYLTSQICELAVSMGQVNGRSGFRWAVCGQLTTRTGDWLIKKLRWHLSAPLGLSSSSGRV